MPEYLTHWQFWAAVVVVALVVNYLYNNFTGKGKIV